MLNLGSVGAAMKGMVLKEEGLVDRLLGWLGPSARRSRHDVCWAWMYCCNNV